MKYGAIALVPVSSVSTRSNRQLVRLIVVPSEGDARAVEPAVPERDGRHVRLVVLPWK